MPRKKVSSYTKSCAESESHRKHITYILKAKRKLETQTNKVYKLCIFPFSSYLMETENVIENFPINEIFHCFGCCMHFEYLWGVWWCNCVLWLKGLLLLYRNLYNRQLQHNFFLKSKNIPEINLSAYKISYSIK